MKYLSVVVLISFLSLCVGQGNLFAGELQYEDHSPSDDDSGDVLVAVGILVAVVVVTFFLFKNLVSKPKATENKKQLSKYSVHTEDEVMNVYSEYAKQNRQLLPLVAEQDKEQPVASGLRIRF